MSASSIAADVRAELAAIAPTRRCDRLAELTAMFHAAGTLHLRGRGALALHLDFASSAVARRARALLDALRVTSEIRTYQRHAFGRETRYQLHVEGAPGALAVAAEAGILDTRGMPLERPPGRIIARACCRGAYLRGAFLGSATLSTGRSPHLELRTATVPGATFLRAVATTEGIRLRVLDKPSHALAYTKSLQAIEAYLAVSGAIETVLVLEERAVVAQLRTQANRLANADHANLVRTSRAAEVQVQAARALRAEGSLERLSDPLRAAAEDRLRHPTLSIRELAERAEPPTTKSAMQRRLARLVELSGVRA